VTPFIDLAGASGALYRFRRFEGQLPPVGGNFVYVVEDDDAVRVVGCGKTRTLLRAQTSDPRGSGQGAALYIRLNVAGALRDFEHQDLIAALPQPFAVYDAD